MTTTSINIAEAKETFTDIVNRVSHHKERITITRRGKDIAAIVPLEDLHRILSIQDKLDLDEAVEALKETRDQGTIPLERLKEEIG